MSKVVWKAEDDIKYSNFYYWPEYNVEEKPTSHEQLSRKGLKDYCRCFMNLMWDREGNIFCPKCKKIFWENFVFNT